jgi:release factor glutamine methyltransferase
MTSWLDLQRAATAKLREAGMDDPGLEARLLLEIAAGVSGADLIAIEPDEAPAQAAHLMPGITARRLAGEPASRIRGWKAFFGRRFIVTTDVLDPRPETEILVAEAIARLPRGGRVLDLGTGSGCIVLSILAEREDASGVGVDISEAAVDVARRNAENLEVDRAAFGVGGWGAAQEGSWPEGLWDVIVSNPPYVTDEEMHVLPPEVADFDPAIALAGGADGLDPYRRIAPMAFERLTPGGWLGVEHGWRQSGAVFAILEQAGFGQLIAFNDLAGHARAAFGRRL